MLFCQTDACFDARLRNSFFTFEQKTVVMKKWMKTGLLVLAAVLVLMQLIPVDRSVPTVNEGDDFLAIVNPIPETATLIKSACYDCHSFKTNYPWYASVAPVSFFVNNHIQEGREHLNFSTWASYGGDKQKHKLEECAEEIAEAHMPEKTYTWMHAGARLTDEQRKSLSMFFSALQLTVPHRRYQEE